MVIKECYVAFYLQNQRYFVLKQSIRCTNQNCFSAIYAVSHYLSQKMPYISPPLCNITREEIYKNRTQTFQPIFQAWNFHLLKIFQQMPSSIIREREKIYLLIPLPEIKNRQKIIQQAEMFNEVILSIEDLSIQNQSLYFSKIFNVDIQNIKFHTKAPKIGLYLTQPVSKEQIYKPRVNKPAIFIGTLFNNQQWKVFDIPHGKIPTVQELLRLDSILITGSSSSVLDKSPQILKAIENLGEAFKQSKTLKIVGVCYGHQLLLQHFGAKVVKKQQKGGLQEVFFEQQVIQKYESLYQLRGMRVLCMSQYHEDYVETVPNEFELIARSESCGVESTISKDGRILTTQFHSQLIYPYLANLKRQFEDVGKTLKYKIEHSNERIEKNKEDSQLVLQMITKFVGY